MVNVEERVIFTKEMKETHKILIPMMLPIHFNLVSRLFESFGYDVELLDTDHEGIILEGLRSVHNDTCYPALLVIGQLVDALKSGKYDLDKTALLITQTGGGCRASNYIHLLRKALKKNGLGHVPVISLNASGLEKNPGFDIKASMWAKALVCLVYGDLITWLANQCRPYEVNEGATEAMIEKWETRLIDELDTVRNMRLGKVNNNFKKIVKDFASLELTGEQKPKVGIVGEIYIKYAPLGNNNLEKFLADEGCEVVVPGLFGFLYYTLDARLVDYDLYGGSKKNTFITKVFMKLMRYIERNMIKAIKDNSNFVPMGQLEEAKKLVEGYVGHGNKMGEGWLLTAEMLELCHMGVHNIVCAQPFGCLPNHIVGKGMIRKIKQEHPEANIVSIDYDPGASKVNQENRIKLMLANASGVEKKIS